MLFFHNLCDACFRWLHVFFFLLLLLWYLNSWILSLNAFLSFNFNTLLQFCSSLTPYQCPIHTGYWAMMSWLVVVPTYFTHGPFFVLTFGSVCFQRHWSNRPPQSKRRTSGSFWTASTSARRPLWWNKRSIKCSHPDMTNKVKHLFQFIWSPCPGVTWIWPSRRSE